MDNKPSATVDNYERTTVKQIYDTVFSDLFKDKKYLLDLYKTLHPEDLSASESELDFITISNVLVRDIYNDLGFTVGDRLMILVEAQSTWSPNIVIRIIEYLGETLKRYYHNTRENLYLPTKVVLPKPEFYVIYTGDRKERQEYISLEDEFFNDNSYFLNARAKVIYPDDSKSIINQYITYTKVIKEQIAIYGRTEKAVREAIIICKNRDILRVESRAQVTLKFYKLGKGYCI